MNEELRKALDDKVLGMADDELVLGHRNSEWAGHGPILEEDIAFSNLALDEIGHSILWYRIVSLLREEDPETYPDRLVYQRGSHEYLNVQAVELPRGDWAFSMLRQFLFDSYESVHVPGLLSSRHEPVADAAAKVNQEERYHILHTKAWIHRLGLGTDESNSRTQNALNQLWVPFLQLFAPGPKEVLLVDAGMCPNIERTLDDWFEAVVPFLESSALIVPSQREVADFERQSHSAYMETLVGELQEVSKIAPNAAW